MHHYKTYNTVLVDNSILENAGGFFKYFVPTRTFENHLIAKILMKT